MCSSDKDKSTRRGERVLFEALFPFSTFKFLRASKACPFTFFVLGSNFNRSGQSRSIDIIALLGVLPWDILKTR